MLGVGRLSKQKDFPTLVRAFARVRLEREVHLVILGEAGTPKKTEQRLAELNTIAAGDSESPVLLLYSGLCKIP